MTLAQLKEVLLEPIRHEYQFEPGFYRGQQEVMSEQITMQEMNMESGSTLIIYFPYPEGVAIVRPLSKVENSLSMKCANTPTKASFIGQLDISSNSESHSPILSVTDTGNKGEDNIHLISENPSVLQWEKGEQHAISMMTFENTVLQSGDYSSCTPISNLLRGRSVKGPPYEATVEKIVQQVKYVTERDMTSRLRYLTVFLMLLHIFWAYFWSDGMVGVERDRPLTAVELYISCTCANTDDSACKQPSSFDFFGGLGEGAIRCSDRSRV